MNTNSAITGRDLHRVHIGICDACETVAHCLRCGCIPVRQEEELTAQEANHERREREMSACACIGPVGDCPCIRRARGLPIPIAETYIAPELFALLPDEDKETINQLKLKALGLHLTKGPAIREANGGA